MIFSHNPLAGTEFTTLNLPGLLKSLDSLTPSSIISSGGLVSQWDDISPNGNNVSQATSGQRPNTGTRTVNGHNFIDFDGVDETLERSDALGLTGNPDLFYGAVLAIDTNDESRRPICIGNDATSNAGKVFAFGTDGSHRYNDGFRSFTALGTGFVIVFAQRAAGDDYGSGLMYYDNVLQSEVATANPTNTPTLDDELTIIGGDFSGSGVARYYDGAIGASVVCNAVLSSTERLNLFNFWNNRFS